MCHGIERIELEDILKPLCMYDAWHVFSTKSDKIIHDCIPMDVPRAWKNIYMTQNVLNMKNRKSKLWRQYLETKSSSVYEKYRKPKNFLWSLT